MQFGKKMRRTDYFNMNFLNKLERKFGKIAIPNLIIYIIGAYMAGYLLEAFAPTLVNYLTLDPYYILHGQIWRLVSWVLIPPSGSIYGFNMLFVLIMLFFYYQLGTALERTWGTFRFNVYIFGGLFFTIIGAFLLYLVLFLIHGMPVIGIGGAFSTSYINESIFLAFAVCYPDMEIRLYFLIPIKMKWMAIVYGVLILLGFVTSGIAGKVAIAASLLNFLVFYLSTRKSPRTVYREAKRKQAYRAGARPTTMRNGKVIARHKCAICGRTELDDPNLEFRFCSKCQGNYEYCQDHLFTHEHKKNKS